MAPTTVYTSDLDAAEGARTFMYAIGKDRYEVDLTQEQFDQHFGPIFAVSRLIDRSVPDMAHEEREEIREWALENGFDVARYGRIPKKVLRSYAQAHCDKAIDCPA